MSEVDIAFACALVLTIFAVGAFAWLFYATWKHGRRGD